MAWYVTILRVVQQGDDMVAADERLGAALDVFEPEEIGGWTTVEYQHDPNDWCEDTIAPNSPFGI